ncbi:anhydro-N-acetylmuramic acid kinase, partial [Bacillus mycoides]|uniref:anhydro-N-acetylmuramic acid kinase n=1 Tax=Bacillus mycoides TaxID=1405 RepID=UPI002355BA13
MTHPFPKHLKQQIIHSLSLHTSNLHLISTLNFKLPKLFPDATNQLSKKPTFPLQNFHLIGSHAQTIYHHPFQQHNFLPSTLQIGQPSLIAYQTNTTVISNFP